MCHLPCHFIHWHFIFIALHVFHVSERVTECMHQCAAFCSYPRSKHFVSSWQGARKQTRRQKGNEWEMFVFKRTVYYDNSMEFNAVRWQKMNECGVMTPNKNLAGNRQRLFANFQYDWINGMCIKRAWNEEQNVSTRSARLLIAMPCQRPQKRFIFMVVGCVFIVSLNGNIIINDFEHTNKYVILSTAPMG